MSLFPQTTHFISLERAIEMTTLFREEQNNILIPELRGIGILPICETFNREAFDTLLAEEGCAGLRIYLGMDTNLNVRLITVAVNASGEDMLPSSALKVQALEGDEREIVEDGIRCPTTCPPESPLNGG